MTPERLEEITRRYGQLKVAVVGDVCLDRYFDIDPRIQEVSIETQLPVYNITRVRCQPGGAGTILNNLSALGVSEIYVATLAGEDGEGYELKRALQTQLNGIRLNHYVESSQRRTFTYTKPLILEEGKPPQELNRLDIKNWSPTPPGLQMKICEAVRTLGPKVDAMILLDQVDVPETGVVTAKVLETVRELSKTRPELLILADSRRGLRGYPPVGFKMNAAELGALMGTPKEMSLEEIRSKALELEKSTGKHVFVTLSERGILGAFQGRVEHVPALPLRGPIDIVGAGDAVTANLASALAAGANFRESIELACIASSIVIHQLGTTGTANAKQMAELLASSTLAKEN